MRTYIVLYRIDSIQSPLDAPFGFKCQADNGDHAEEQCVDVYPDCDVVWIVETNNMQTALYDYFDLGVKNEG